MRSLARSSIGILLALLSGASFASGSIPSCRLDDGMATIVRETIERALGAFRAGGIKLAIDKVVVNPGIRSTAPTTLTIFIVKDATGPDVDSRGCTNRPPSNGERLDSISTRGGCVADGGAALEIRCSADALSVFANMGQRTDRANPALLYVLSHELGHIYQRRSGEYAGRVDHIQLGAEPSEKLDALRESCAPAMTLREEKADEYALDVLERLLAAAPYREKVLSEQGSMLWNVDLLAIAADQWQRLSGERELLSQQKIHRAFVPTEFPTPPGKVRTNAHRFVCDVLRGRNGEIAYPARSSSHPSAEQRLRRIAEKLKAQADLLPITGGSNDFAPIVQLQEDLSPNGT